MLKAASESCGVGAQYVSKRVVDPKDVEAPPIEQVLGKTFQEMSAELEAEILENKITP